MKANIKFRFHLPFQLAGLELLHIKQLKVKEELNMK